MCRGQTSAEVGNRSAQYKAQYMAKGGEFPSEAQMPFRRLSSAAGGGPVVKEGAMIRADGHIEPAVASHTKPLASAASRLTACAPIRMNT